MNALTSITLKYCINTPLITKIIKRIEISNYRQITNLQFLSKLKEKVISPYLTNFITKTNRLQMHFKAHKKDTKHRNYFTTFY